MPQHIRFLLTHAAIGAGAALFFVALLLAFDIMGLRHLVMNTAEGFIGLAVMTVLFIITFGSVQMGRAIMSLGDDEDNPRGGHKASEMLIPIPVEQDDPRHRRHR